MNDDIDINTLNRLNISNILDILKKNGINSDSESETTNSVTNCNDSIIKLLKLKNGEISIPINVFVNNITNYNIDNRDQHGQGTPTSLSVSPRTPLF